LIHWVTIVRAELSQEFAVILEFLDHGPFSYFILRAPLNSIFCLRSRRTGSENHGLKGAYRYAAPGRGDSHDAEFGRNDTGGAGLFINPSDA